MVQKDRYGHENRVLSKRLKDLDLLNRCLRQYVVSSPEELDHENPAPAGNQMKIRAPRIRESTARILVNGNSCGTGFLVSDSTVFTNFHVVQQMSATSSGQAQLSFANTIEVELSSGQVVPASVDACCQGAGMPEAISKDYAVLNIAQQALPPFKLGSFVQAAEGSDIYLAGYPLRINQSVVARGMLSTKFSDQGRLNQGSRDVAWLDATLNSGNSGGPVVLMSDDPDEDVVVAIATFNLNPFASFVDKLDTVVQGFQGSVGFMGIKFGDFSGIVSAALRSNSLGVGGCVSIDYARKASGL